MTVDAERYLAPFEAFQIDPSDTPVHTIGAIEGVVPDGKLTLQVLMVTEELLVVRVTRSKGLIDKPHQHDDHESVATLISGRLRNVIGDQTFIAERGATWRHPAGGRPLQRGPRRLRPDRDQDAATKNLGFGRRLSRDGRLRARLDQAECRQTRQRAHQANRAEDHRHRRIAADIGGPAGKWLHQRKTRVTPRVENAHADAAVALL